MTVAIEETLNEINNKLNLLLGTDFGNEFSADCMFYSALSEWYNATKAPRLKHKTLVVILNSIRHIKAAIPDKPLKEIMPSDIQNTLNAIELSSVRRTVYDTFKQFYDYAVRLDIVRYNPMAKVDKVYHKRNRGRALTLSEQRQFLNGLNSSPRHTIFKFYLLSGCRRAEALSLRWRDIDFEAKQVHISGTKTSKSERFIPLFPQLAELIESIPHAGDLIFPYSHYTVQRAFYTLKRKQGFMFRIHDLRHTFATRCLESGINIGTVSKWLGHSNISMTVNVYMHILTAFEKEEAVKFNPQF